MYEKAANSFKIAKKWDEAGDAFCKAAKLCIDNKTNHEAAAHYSKAATAYKKSSPEKAIKVLKDAIEIYTEMGRFSIAAKQHMSIAEIYEQDLYDIEQSIKHYELASEYYKGEDSNSSAMKCQLKVAHFSATLGQYDKAAVLFEEAGKASSENKLLRYGAKEHFFKAVICQFCIDLINGQKALKIYEENYQMFADSRECTLLKKISEALENENIEAFTTALTEYDTLTRLEPWTTSLFLKIKRTISGDEDLT
ncbi:unnamed protein product [Protopolystoma xenopodis]|uniref:Alpha-soluble NSF attachment protein n=1 Tax=Protopolystoma xenopodis TaxID=117903 RepID=A0A448WIS8_9PLAT|nr:unnamed protein product [Protopolystoma xenopodis]